MGHRIHGSDRRGSRAKRASVPSVSTTARTAGDLVVQRRWGGSVTRAPAGEARVALGVGRQRQQRGLMLHAARRAPVRRLLVCNVVTVDGYYEARDETIGGLFDRRHPDCAGDDSFDHDTAERLRAADASVLSGRTSFLGNEACCVRPERPECEHHPPRVRRSHRPHRRAGGLGQGPGGRPGAVDRHAFRAGCRSTARDRGAAVRPRPRAGVAAVAAHAPAAGVWKHLGVFLADHRCDRVAGCARRDRQPGAARPWAPPPARPTMGMRRGADGGQSRSAARGCPGGTRCRDRRTSETCWRRPNVSGGSWTRSWRP